MNPCRSAYPEGADGPLAAERDYVVVGSGPAGVVCAQALVETGAKVRMLDAGVTLESNKKAFIQRLARRDRADWAAEDLAAYQNSMNPDVGGVPLKLVYGSDFAYREADAHLQTHYENSGLRPSFARGGLSNVWGAAMMPYLEKDLTDWPFGIQELAPHYEAVLKFTGLSATQDALAHQFPLFTNSPTELKPSRQAERLLYTMECYRQALNGDGILFGRSRVAIRGQSPGQQDGTGCGYCRLCMHGCPYDLIYSSSHTLRQLEQHPNFTYEPGVVVTRATETGQRVEISGYERHSRTARTWDCSRVFIAAGTIPTTKILLRSLQAYEETVWLKDSQYFLVPLLLRKKAENAAKELLHGLSQIFLEFVPGNNAPSAHLQIYSNSDLVNQAVANTLGPVGRWFGFLRRELEDRLLIGQGFLHSNLSSRIAVTLKEEGIDQDRLHLRGEINPAAKREVRRVVRKLVRHARHIGAVPIPPMLKVAEPGRSFHCGGSFPMRRNPARFETDLLGRTGVWKRIHAVDSTVFPSIPATTISFSAMANAHRIASSAAKLDHAADGPSEKPK